jgi:hypothetical protein
LFKSFDVSQNGTSSSADLGGSSEYSNEIYVFFIILCLKAEVEKGSMWTAFGHGLVDPKTLGKSFGNLVIINIIIIIIIII